MKTKLFFLPLFLLAVMAGKAQVNVEFEKDNFKDRKDEFKEAKRNLEAGDDLFKQAMAAYRSSEEAFVNAYHFYPNNMNEVGASEAAEGFRMALEYYQKAQAFNPNNARLNYQIGACYYFSPDKKTMGLTFLETAQKLNASVAPELHYYLGRDYHLAMQWDKAIGEYKLYQQALQLDVKANKDRIDDMNRKIQECLNGKELVQHPQRVFIDELGAVVNSKYPDYSPLINADESVMFFTSRRDNSTGGLQDGAYREDLYMTSYKNGSWTSPVNVGKPINTDDHDASAGLSPDGQTLYLYKFENGGDIYECHQDGAMWSKPERLSKNINSDAHESSVSLSFDAKKLYFVSEKKDGSMGYRDIWFSSLDEKGKWGPSTNMGNVINTKYGEEGVFMHPDGKTVYFSSQGHKSMGGYDIFKSEWKDGKWSTPENLGYPINGPDDDVFFVISGSGRHGYYASAKAGGTGEKDIYKITFLGPEKPLALNTEDNLIASIAEPVKNAVAAPPVAITTAQVTILKGTITDAISQKPVQATIELVDNQLSQVIATFTSNSSTGKYLVSLPAGKNYGIAVKADGYLFHSENFDIPATSAYQEVVKDVALKPVAVGSVIVLRNIFFDYNKATLRPESTVELDRLVSLLTQVPTMKIEIGGHTDIRGNDDYNLKLSQSRAESVVNFLVQKGIAKDRLTAVGYGETKVIDTGNTEEAHQNNRRTEFKILSK